MDILAYTEKSKCNGCGACINICPRRAIHNQADEYGFLYPSIDEETCVHCGQCVFACNSIQHSQKNCPSKAYAAVNQNKKILQSSSSGGVFSVIAEYVLENGGAVCGCVFDQSLNPIHICTEEKDEYLRMRRSKYVQSNVGYIYQDIKKRLNNNQMVLFSGTPCQVAALKSIVGENQNNLFTIDLICHGVPSELMFKKFIQYLEKKYKTEIVDFNFRSKKYGWARFSMEYTDKNGKTKNIGKANEFYMPAFTAGYIMRPSCYDCKYACPERVGDITLGDLWGYESFDLTCGTVDGISVCTLNNDKAIQLMPILSAQLSLEEIDYQHAVDGNTCLRHPTIRGEKWDMYMQALKADDIEGIAKKYIRKNKKAILRGRIKLLVPISFFRSIKKMRQSKNK